MNETICPINFTEKRTGIINGVTKIMDSQIIDDEIHAIISGIPNGVKFLMVFDSCHSGTIGDLKYDIAHYHGSTNWQDDDLTTSQGTETTSSVPLDPVVLGNSVINCNASWIYVPVLRQLWITPMDHQLYQVLVGNKFIIPISTNVPAQLFNNPNKIMMFNSNFKKLANGQYEISCTELGINNLIVNSRDLATTTTSAYYNTNIVSRAYDQVTGKHYHFNRAFGQKRTFSLRSVAGCKGGELRIIAGCEENQTSAGTAQYGGACTNAVLETIRSLQGLPNFFEKIFNHNILDLKFIEDSINNNLSKFGYTQHSIVSWEHATGVGARMLLPGWEKYTSGVEVNRAFLPELPVQYVYRIRLN